MFEEKNLSTAQLSTVQVKRSTTGENREGISMHLGPRFKSQPQGNKFTHSFTH